MQNTKSMLMVLILSFLVRNIQCSESIGFVHPHKHRQVSLDKTEFPMTVRMLIFTDVDFQITLLSNIKTQLTSLESIPGVKDQANVSESTIRNVRQSVVTADALIQKLRTISKYSGTEIINATDHCRAEISNNIDLLLFAAENMITESVKAFGLEHTVSDLTPGNNAYINLVNLLQDAYVHLRNLEDKTSDFLDKLESLTSGQISPSIYASVQMSVCVSESELDKITLKHCIKTTEGLLCYLDVEVYSKSEIYLTYIPVNYDGVQILLPENQVLARAEDEKYGLLTCEEEESTLINDCTLIPWEFSDKILGPGPEKFIAEFNFTLAEPPLPIQIHDGSVLIMDKRIKISMKTGDTGAKDLNNLSPMAISFGASSTLTTTLDKIKLKFKAGSLESGMSTETSLFNATVIALMHEKALMAAFKGMDWNNIFKYLSFIIQVLVLPVAVTSCSLSLFAVIRSVLSRRRRKRKEKIAKKYDLRRNYELNKRVTRKIRKGSS